MVGQEHITTTLKNALKSGKISHAYLFTGPRGVGKTSVARILAHEFNQFTYDETQNHIDIIEIDAASNRRIDEIRELRDRVHIAPTSGKYKVYIIDEVHMLTKEAFNALLKTLEEPPRHVIFILATTEAHKLPETIISRTQRFTFKPIENRDAIQHLQSIAEAEKIHIDNEALQLIVDHAEGSFRDSIGLLDQASNTSKNITLPDIEKMLGVAPRVAVMEIVQLVMDGNARSVVNKLDQMLLGGSTPTQIAKQLNHELRIILLDSPKPDISTQVASLMRELIAVTASHDPTMSLQLALLDTVFQMQPAVVQAELDDKVVTVATLTNTTEAPKKQVQAEAILPNERDEQQDVVIADELWPRVVNEIKKYHNTLYSIARMAKSSINELELTLVFSFPFHEKRLSEPKNKQVVLDILKRLTGDDFTIVCRVENKQQIHPPATLPKSNDIDTISNIFGSAEVLES